MTMYLALQAGFAPSVATFIAQGTERPDLDYRSPVPAGKKVFRGDNSGKEILRQWHFPKPELDSGAVFPCSDSAREKIESALKRQNLRDFSEGLHPFEDSWAHRGVSSLGYAGHADDRGGAARHNSDLTYLHPDDTLEAAEATYLYLKAYAFLYPHQATDSPAVPDAPTPWMSIRGDVANFASLRTKSAKRNWLHAHGVDLPPSLWSDVDLPENWPPSIGDAATMVSDEVKGALGKKALPWVQKHIVPHPWLRKIANWIFN
jgi:hypothetical protein